MRFSARFAGAGGHGIITASVVLADAATSAGFHVCQSQSYGPEARGGTAHADVIVSDAKVLHPKIVRADLLIALTQGGLEAFASNINEGGTLVADDAVVGGPVRGRIASVPLLALAREKFGSENYAGILAVGAALAVFGVIPPDFAKEAVASRLPLASLAANEAALDLGLRTTLAALGAPPAQRYEADL